MVLSLCFYVSVAGLFRSKRYTFFIVIHTLYNIYYFAQDCYYRCFGTFFSFQNGSTLKELSTVKNSVLTFLSFEQLFYLLSIILFIVLEIRAKTKENKIYSIWKQLFKVILSIEFFIILLQFLAPFLTGMSSEGISRQGSLSYAYQTFLDKTAVMQGYGTTVYIKRDIEISLSNISENLSEEDENDIVKYKNWTEHNGNDYTNIFKGKNLILVQAESFAPQAINEQLTPNLYKIKEEGMYFNNYYAPLYPANTNDTEFASQTGLLPSLSGKVTAYSYATNEYPYSLANLFKEQNYSSESYHTFTGDFYNRYLFHESLGFDEFHDLRDIAPNLVEEANGIYWIPDKVLSDYYLENTDFDKQYFSFIITASGHMPYLIEERDNLLQNYNEVKRIYPDINERVQCYLATQMEFDEAIGDILNNLDDNTILIIYGDHYPYGLRQDAQDALLFDGMERYKVPLMVYGNGVEEKEIDKLCSTIDLYPTIANMFGLDLNNSIIFGTDIMSDDPCTVYFKDGNILTEDYYGIGAEEVYSISQTVLKTDYYNKQNN